MKIFPIEKLLLSKIFLSKQYFVFFDLDTKKELKIADEIIFGYFFTKQSFERIFIFKGTIFTCELTVE